MNRLAGPALVLNSGRLWGLDYKERRARDGGYKFRWPAGCYEDLRTLLRNCTGDHCAFCDGYLGITSPVTVEHFLPKSRFPRVAFHWGNLYPCCYLCQMSKGEKFLHGLLRPDSPGYRFNDYFIIDYATGRLRPIPSLGKRDYRRAEITIDLYGLNSPARNAARLEALQEAEQPNAVAGECRNFRYLFA